MQQADVVCRLLFPAYKNAVVTVQPRMDSFDDPPASALSAAALCLLLATRTNVGRVAAATSRATNGGGIVAFVTAEMLLAPTGRPRTVAAGSDSNS
jgi:hypothetical protein